jgi:hypothetical protein
MVQVRVNGKNKMVEMESRLFKISFVIKTKDFLMTIYVGIGNRSLSR